MVATFNLYNTCKAIQTYGSSLSGLTSAPLKFPNAINSGDLPLSYTWPGQGTTNKTGDLRYSERNYDWRVLVDPIGQANVHDRNAAAMDLLGAAIEYWGTENSQDAYRIQNYPHLIELRGEIRDTGLTILSYSGVDYMGFILTLPIWEEWRDNDYDGELPWPDEDE